MSEIAQLEQALQASPENWQLRRTVAIHYSQAGQATEAARIVSQAPEIPGDEDSILFAAQMLAGGDANAALGLLDNYLSVNNSSSGGHLLKGRILRAVGDISAAESHFKTANTLDPTVSIAEEMGEAAGAVSGAGATNVAETAVAEAVAVSEDDDVHLAEVAASERAFIVAEGEAVKAAEKEPDAKQKVSALSVALAVHLIIALAATFFAVSEHRKQPPQITVSSIGPADEDAMQNQTLQKKQQKTAAQVTAAQPVVNVESFSSVSLPEITDLSTDLTMVALASDAGTFGLSMDGIGEVSNMGAIPASMRSRCSMSQRMQRLRESGGDDRAEKAVRDALAYLTKQQNEDGSMGKHFKAAMTGLSLLAYLGHCETPESPKFGDSVVSAALYLMDRGLKQDGYIHSDIGSGNHHAYEHAIATYALSELFTMTKESGREIPRLESVLKKAVDIIVDGQRKEGGWDYGYRTNGQSSDMSVTGWQIQALKAAYNTQRKFSGVDKSLTKAIEYLPTIQDSRGAFKYRPDNAAGKPTLTGAALLGMQIWGQKDSNPYNKGLVYLQKAYPNPVPNMGGHGFYDEYYNTQVFFLHGEKEWEWYNGKFQKALLDQQNPDGSWGRPEGTDPKKIDNQTMNTAWGALQLEVYYRYLPTTEKVEGLKAR